MGSAKFVISMDQPATGRDGIRPVETVVLEDQRDGAFPRSLCHLQPSKFPRASTRAPVRDSVDKVLILLGVGALRDGEGLAVRFCRKSR